MCVQNRRNEATAVTSGGRPQVSRAVVPMVASALAVSVESTLYCACPQAFHRIANKIRGLVRRKGISGKQEERQLLRLYQVRTHGIGFIQHSYSRPTQWLQVSLARGLEAVLGYQPAAFSCPSRTTPADRCPALHRSPTSKPIPVTEARDILDAFINFGKSIASLEVLRQLIYEANEEYKREVQTMETDFRFRLDEVTAMQGHAKWMQEQAKSMQEQAIAAQEHVTSEFNEMLRLISISG